MFYGIEHDLHWRMFHMHMKRMCILLLGGNIMDWIVFC